MESGFACDHWYQAYPDRLHGGINATLLDAAMTHCLCARRVRVYNTRLRISYDQPVVIGRPVLVRGLADPRARAGLPPVRRGPAGGCPAGAGREVLLRTAGCRRMIEGRSGRGNSAARRGGTLSYYRRKLAGNRLRQCYEIATPRVRQYLRAEIEFVRDRLRPGDRALELGCGYGRVVFALESTGAAITGIDVAEESIALAESLIRPGSICSFQVMDATDLRFPDAAFDLVFCVQNGICAFGADQNRLLGEALRVTSPGGIAMFSSYADAFWPHRLRWFERQAELGLVGEIDREETGGGVIACRDGFRSGTMTPAGFGLLAGRAGAAFEIREVDRSSVFCLLKRAPAEAGRARERGPGGPI